MLTEESAQGLQWLREQGVAFDQMPGGALSLAREAAHQAARVVHAGGDATGKVLIQTIIDRVLEAPSIRILTDTFADELITDGTRVFGLVVDSAQFGRQQLHAPHVVLATGGIGSLWLHTTNPIEATGDGLAMAARAGAELADLEFVQFHPTALAGDHDQTSLPLLTEALRGAGATLIDDAATRFMPAEHEAAELAPRDIVARAIYQRIRDGRRVYLDLRPVIAAGKSDAFPQALAVARQYGFDPETGPLPVTPAAHYHMGGVATDHKGRTSVAGLWACGEVAATRVHGANRLASNSLLEALIYARRVAMCITAEDNTTVELQSPRQVSRIRTQRSAGARAVLHSILHAVRTVMSDQVGILRSGRDLETAVSTLQDLQRRFDMAARECDSARLWGETRNSLLVARLVTLAALRREESRGAHFRHDFPIARELWCRHQGMTITALERAGDNVHTT
jgi:L-aspartate oxidase